MDRELKPLMTQGHRHVDLNFSMTFASGAPQFVEGDLAGKIAGSYLKLVDTGTGVLTITTKDKFLGFVSVMGSLGMATPITAWELNFGKPSQNTDKTWSVTANTFLSGTAHDIVDGDIINLRIVLRNSTVLP